MKLYLTGPKAGKTIKLNGVGFVSGIADIDAKDVGLARYFAKCYAAYPEGSPEFLEAMKRDGGGKEIYYGKRDIPQHQSGTEGGLLPDGRGAAATATENQRPDAGADAHESGSGSEGSGHEDSGASVQEAVIEACLKLDTRNPRHWTPGGVPKFPEVLNTLGANPLEITRKQISTYGLTRKQVAERQDA